MPGFFGGYFGLGVGGTTAADPDLIPIEVPLTVADAEYTDHTARALDRLCQYAKYKVGE